MIYLGSDYLGFKLKKQLITYLKTQLHKQAVDLGAKARVEGDDAIDYAVPVAKAVVKNKNNRGILICSSGHAMCITANKIKGARAVLGYNIKGAELARLHDDANILCLAGHFLTLEHAAAIVKTFLQTKFEPIPRRVRRLKKLTALEK
jgi:ribose 5-phosphate isomerase B